MSELRAMMDRILNTLAEEDEIKAGRRQIYADAQAAGYNKTALGLAIREIRARGKVETPAQIERQSVADLYIAEYDAPRVHVREAAE